MFGRLVKKLKQKCNICKTQLEERVLDESSDEHMIVIFCPSCEMEVDDSYERNYVRNNIKKINKPKRGGKRGYDEWD